MSNDRVDVRYHHWFGAQTDNGKAFRWLKDNLGDARDDSITNIVRFVYLPIAIAEAGASRQQVEIEIQRARDYFNEKMMAALGSCCEGAASDGSSPTLPNGNYRAGVSEVRKDNATTPNGVRTFPTTTIDPDDDFLELDEEKLMEE